MSDEKPDNGQELSDRAFQEQTESLQKAANELRNLDAVKSSQKTTKSRQMNSWLRYSTVGIQFAVTMALATAAGWGLDYWLGTLPLFLVVGSLGGTVAAMVSVIRQVLGMESKPEQGRETE